MQIIKSIESLRETLKPFQKEGKKVGLVPTMGALHDGHGALIKASVKDCDITVVSVFLNPIQFGRNEDLDKYQRTTYDYEDGKCVKVSRFDKEGNLLAWTEYIYGERGEMAEAKNYVQDEVRPDFHRSSAFLKYETEWY